MSGKKNSKPACVSLMLVLPMDRHWAVVSGGCQVRGVPGILAHIASKDVSKLFPLLHKNDNVSDIVCTIMSFFFR